MKQYKRTEDAVYKFTKDSIISVGQVDGQDSIYSHEKVDTGLLLEILKDKSEPILEEEFNKAFKETLSKINNNFNN